MNIQVVTYEPQHLPRLVNQNKTPEKWYIGFYLYNPETGKYVRQRRRIPLNAQHKHNRDKCLR